MSETKTNVITRSVRLAISKRPSVRVITVFLIISRVREQNAYGDETRKKRSVQPT